MTAPVIGASNAILPHTYRQQTTPNHITLQRDSSAIWTRAPIHSAGSGGGNVPIPRTTVGSISLSTAAAK